MDIFLTNIDAKNYHKPYIKLDIRYTVQKS